MNKLLDWIDRLRAPNLTVRDRTALALQPGQVCMLRGVAGWRVQVGAGCLWVTESGDPADHCLTRGQHHMVRGRGLVVIEGLGSVATRLELLPARAPRGVRLLPMVTAPRRRTA